MRGINTDLCTTTPLPPHELAMANVGWGINIDLLATLFSSSQHLNWIPNFKTKYSYTYGRPRRSSRLHVRFQ